jgi:hypothetical protein
MEERLEENLPQRHRDTEKGEKTDIGKRFNTEVTERRRRKI